VLLLLLSRELFFFALFRAFVGVVVRDVSSNKKVDTSGKRSPFLKSSRT